jgi:hypothetical protein
MRPLGERLTVTSQLTSALMGERYEFTDVWTIPTGIDLADQDSAPLDTAEPNPRGR